MRLGFVLACALCFPGLSPAQSNASGGWQYELTPYFWGAGMKGDVQAGALPRVAVDMSIAEILDNLDAGAMGSFEARNGRWGMLFDAIYMKLTDSATATRTGPGPIGATLTASASVTMKQTVLAGAVTYRAVEGRSPVDIVGGLRYNKIESDAVITASLLALAGTLTASGKKDWVDPYIGARIRHPLSERLTLVAYGDVGGFNVGSDFSWQALVGVDYAFSKTFSGKLGYRAIYADYDKNGFLYDMTSSGAYLGLGIRF